MSTNEVNDNLAETIAQTRKALQPHEAAEVKTEVAGVDRLADRLRTSAEPYLGGFGWSLSAPPGGTVIGRVSVGFPNPAAIPSESFLYVHVWIGAGVGAPTVAAELSGVDYRFPRLTQPNVTGVQPGTTQTPKFPVPPNIALLAFQFDVPYNVERSVYLGNVALVRRLPFSAGELVDRTSFAFRVRGIDEPPDLNPSV